MANLAIAGAPPMDDEQMRKLRREAAIRQKEDEYERKRREEDEQKLVELERLKQEARDEQNRQKMEKINHLKKQAELRARVKAETDRMNQKRDNKIKLREEAWKKKANIEIQAIVNNYIEEENRVDDRRCAAREKREGEIAQGKERHKEHLLQEQDREMQREENIAKLDLERQIRAVLKCDEIKEEADDELRSFIQQPFPVPLKQVLAGRVRPVPRVTTLLASFKDCKEELEELQAQDFEMRATLRHQSLFQYVHDIQAKADEMRIRAPEPVLSDLGRKANSGKKGSASPKGKKGNMSPSGTAKKGFGHLAKKN